MATVRKRSWKSGNERRTAWIADYFDQSGKRHLKTFPTKKAADTWLVGTRHEVSQGMHTPERDSVTVAAAAEIWLTRGELNKLERSTLAKYRNHVDLHIVPLLGAIKLANLSTPAVVRFRDEMLARASRPMARKVIGSLKAMLGEAQRRGLVAQNVAAPVKVDAKKRDKRRITIGRDLPTKAEVNAILSAAAGRWRPLFVTAVFTGMRASELRGLTWADVDFDRRLIHVHQRADQWNDIGAPKSEAGDRRIPMTPMVFSILREWRLACPRLGRTDTDPGKLWLVFPNGAGRPESHTNIVNRGFDVVQAAAGVTEAHPTKKTDDGSPARVAKYSLHGLRHFFASWAIEQGFQPKRVQALLGHASITMTFDVYGHLFPNAEDDHARFAAGELALLK